MTDTVRSDALREALEAVRRTWVEDLAVEYPIGDGATLNPHVDAALHYAAACLDDAISAALAAPAAEPREDGLRAALWSLHQADHDQENDETWCSSCHVEWPCPTAEVLIRHAAAQPGPSEPGLRGGELTEASLEVLAAMRRVIEQVREMAFPDQVGEPIEQDAMRALLRLVEEQAAARALAAADSAPGEGLLDR